MIESYIIAHLTPMLPTREGGSSGGDVACVNRFFETVKSSPMINLPLDSMHQAVTRLMQIEERFESLLATHSRGIAAPDVPNCSVSIIS